MADEREDTDGRPGYKLWINGLRVGVNADDYIREQGLPLGGSILDRASQIAAREIARGRTTPRDTIKLEDVREAENEVAGESGPGEVEPLRGRVARDRYR